MKYVVFTKEYLTYEVGRVLPVNAETEAELDALGVIKPSTEKAFLEGVKKQAKSVFDTTLMREQPKEDCTDCEGDCEECKGKKK